MPLSPGDPYCHRLVSNAGSLLSFFNIFFIPFLSLFKFSSAAAPSSLLPSLFSVLLPTQRAKPELCKGPSLLDCFSGLAALTPKVLLVLSTSERARSSLLLHCDTTYPSTFVVSSFFFFPSIIDITIDNMLIFMDFILVLDSFFRINSQDWDPWANRSEFCVAFILCCHHYFPENVNPITSSMLVIL